jgi:outer membrane lipoprotein LolB
LPAAPQRPRRIDLERNTEQAGKVAIRIVIDTWQPH